MTYIFKIIPQILDGLGITFGTFGVTLVLSLPLGMLIALCRVSKNKVLSSISGIYTWVLRGTPLLLQMFFVFFGLPAIGIQLFGRMRLPYVYLAFVLNYAAYFAEIFRAGIQSIDKGQMEAGRSLGMSWAQTMRYIIMPQAFKRIIPPLGNEFIAMLKDSSLVSVIGFEELTRRGQLIIARTYASFEIWMAVALVYLVMTFAVARFTGYLERRFDTK